MWQHAGILRDEDGLIVGLHQLQQLRAEAGDLSVQTDRTSRRYERAQNVRFMLTTAETILRGSLERTESRGAHARTDYPESNPSWRQNIRCVPTPEGMEIEYQDPVVLRLPSRRPSTRSMSSITTIWSSADPAREQYCWTPRVGASVF
jgi:succinate dehydrogenase/fumarate reductase flavoprotein subunit